MGRIYIDTDEIRDLARFLRRRSGDLTPIKQEANRATGRTFIALPWAAGIHWEHGVANAGLDVLGTRLHFDAIGLDVHATMVEANERIDSLVRRWIPRIRRWASDGWRRYLFGRYFVTNQVLQGLLGALALVVGTVAKNVFGPVWLVTKQFRLFEVTEIKTSDSKYKVGNGFGSVAGILRELQHLDEQRRPGEISIIRMNPGQDPPRYMVMLPGIKVPYGSSSQDGLDAFEGTVTGDSPYLRAVRKAMEEAGIGANAEVLLVGHSQGALAATGLAANPNFRAQFNVEGVIAVAPTSMSIVGRIPADIPVLPIINESDFVPRLALYTGSEDPASAALGLANHPPTTFATGHVDMFSGHMSNVYADFAQNHQFSKQFEDLARAFAPPPGVTPQARQFVCSDR